MTTGGNTSGKCTNASRIVRPTNCLRVNTHASKTANGRLKRTLREATLKLKVNAWLSLALSHIIDLGSAAGLHAARSILCTRDTSDSSWLEDQIHALFSRRGPRHSVRSLPGVEPDRGADRQPRNPGFAFVFRRAALFARILGRPPRHRHHAFDLAAAALWGGAAVSSVENRAQLSQNLDERGFSLGGVFGPPCGKDRPAAACGVRR